MSLKAKIQNLPDNPGIYQFYDINNKLLYVGKSISLKKRVQSYFSGKKLGPKTDALVSKITDVKVIKVFSEFEALMLESELIRQNQPFYNIIAKDDKSPIYIKITNDPIPILTTSRKEKTQKGIFLKGPFPSSKVTKQLLKQIRKIFPYCNHKNPKKPCLYVHLGLCPYPYASEEAKEKYLVDIVKIKKLLKGDNKSLEISLKAEMKTLSIAQKFEDAQLIKNQLDQIEYIYTTYRTPREFLEQPTLVDDLKALRVRDLQKVLNLEKAPRRIECYDISNISGTNATGSMVVFIDGAPAKDQYRRFKIKFTNTPNDFEMMRETLARRFKNDWPKPNLIIIDGGKGQLSAALTIQKKYKYETYIVSLAKRIEEIFIPDSKESIKLPINSPARLLVQSARDEAHRFAITYHRHLRSKNFIDK